jgi:uncharacterized protein YecT (DUF1311 family)
MENSDHRSLRSNTHSFGLVLICLFAGTFLAQSLSPGLVHADCRFGQDYPTDLKCYLVQFPGGECYDSYFGFSSPPNFSKALQCFEGQKTWPYLVVMYLNGQGSPRDVHKAEQWFAAGQKMAPVDWPAEWTAAELSSLKQAIEEAKGTSNKNSSSVDLCSDILSGTTPEMDYCTAIGELVSERQFSEMIATTRAGLGSADALILDRVVASFKAYQEADKNRAYSAWIGGTIRNMRSMGQAKLIRDDFSGLVEKTIRKRDLEPADKVAFQAADDTLNRAYRDNLSGRDPEYRKSARSAELHWIKYRDSWTELATSIYSGKKNSLDPGLSMKIAVTKLRTNELVSSEQP